MRIFLTTLLSQERVSAQNSIIPPNFADISITLSTNTNYYHHINCDMNNDGTTRFTAVIIEDQNFWGVADELHLVLYDGTSSNIISITPSNIIMGNLPGTSTPYTAFTEMSNPDIVLLNGGSKAIITFDTDDATYGAFWAEFEINTSTLTVGQNTTIHGGAVPLSHEWPGGAYCHATRVDRSYDAGVEIFATVCLMDYYSNSNEVPVLNYFEDIGGSYFFNQTSNFAYKPAVDNIMASIPHYCPDIAVSYDLVNNEFCCAVSSIQATATNNYTVYEFEYRPSAPTNFTGNYNNTVSIPISFVPGLVSPRIAAPPNFNTSPVNMVPFGICYSHSPAVSLFTNPALYYAHYDATAVQAQNPDAQNAYANSYNGEPVIEYMQESSGVTQREACMAWPALLNTSPNNEYGIYALMDPILNNSCYDWELVNLTPITTGTNLRYCAAIAATWDNNMDEYVIAWLTDHDLSLKIRPIHTTNYKPEPVKDEMISVYPNPAHDRIHVVLKNGAEYKIVNTLGETLQRGRAADIGETLISTSSMAEGRYVLLSEHQTIPFTITK